METLGTSEKELREQLQERFMARTSLLDETDKSYLDLGDTERTLFSNLRQRPIVCRIRKD